MKPQYEVFKKQEELYAHQLCIKEQRRKELYAKDKRNNQFSSKNERDLWINNEIR